MITLLNVGYELNSPKKPMTVLSNISVSFKSTDKVGIIAQTGSGKSTLARLLCGIEKPTSGSVHIEGHVSWPIGFSAAFHPELTGYENASLIAELAGEKKENIIGFCLNVGGLSAEMGNRLKTFSPTSRAILGYCCSVAIDREIYIADDVLSVGNKVMREKCDHIMEGILQKKGLIFISKNIRQIKQFCTTFYALINGQLIPCPTPEVGEKAIELWNQKQETRNKKQETRNIISRD